MLVVADHCLPVLIPSILFHMIEHRSKAAVLAYAGGGGVPHRASWPRTWITDARGPGDLSHTRAVWSVDLCEQHGPLFRDEKLDQAKATPAQLFRHHTA